MTRGTLIRCAILAIVVIYLPRPATADDPVRLSAEHGARLAAFLRSHGAFCLEATTLKRTIVRLDGRRTYRIACGPDGDAPVYVVEMPPGERLIRF